MKKAPKARTCYICGRPTLLPGYDIHVMKCREIFEQREALKPAKERRACPRDPYASSGGRGFQSLDEENEVIHQNWKSSLPQCVNCGRSFLPEKLPIHQRSCTASNPAKLASSLQRSLARSNFAGGGSQKSYGDDSFDKRPLKSTAGTGFGEYRETPEFGHLIKCRDCGRNFNPESFEKHSKICRKVFKTKRKPFDSAKHRAEGTELAAYYDGRRRGVGGGARRQTNSSGSSMTSAATTTTRPSSSRTRAQGGAKWRAESMAFREAMRQAKMVSRAEKQAKATGVPLHVLLPPSTMTSSNYGIGGRDVDPSFVQCPTCGRSFNQKAGARHIPQCQNIIAKPKRLTRHSGAPSYSTQTPQHQISTEPQWASNSSQQPLRSGSSSRGGGRRASFGSSSGGGGGFGQSTRSSALNNTAITRMTSGNSEDYSYGRRVTFGGGSNDRDDYVGGGGFPGGTMSSKVCNVNEPVRFAGGGGGGGRSQQGGGWSLGGGGGGSGGATVAGIAFGGGPVEPSGMSGRVRRRP